MQRLKSATPASSSECRLLPTWQRQLGLKAGLRARLHILAPLRLGKVDYNLGPDREPSLIKTAKNSLGECFLHSALTSTAAQLTLASIATYTVADGIGKMVSAAAGFRHCIQAMVHRKDASMPLRR